MPFDKFVDMETLSEERRKALQESLQSMTVAELRKIVKELSDFEGDPSQENFVRVIEAHPEASFYRAVTQEGAIILYCPGENTRCLVPARQRDGATARGGETPYERSHRSACFWQKTSTALGRCEQNEDAVQLQNEDFGLWVLPGSGMGPLDDQGKRYMKEAIELFRSGAKIGAKT